MDENLIKLKHLRQAVTQANGKISEVATAAADAIEEVAAAKQDRLTGSPGQVVGFDSNGNAIPQAAPSGDTDIDPSDYVTKSEFNSVIGNIDLALDQILGVSAVPSFYEFNPFTLTAEQVTKSNPLRSEEINYASD